jgi:hypothetical protein
MPTETILKLLENGKWHYIEDIEKEAHLNSFKVKNVTEFLARYNFVKLDEVEQKVKLDLPTMRFFKRIRRLEKEENI